MSDCSPDGTFDFSKRETEWRSGARNEEKTERRKIEEKKKKKKRMFRRVDFYSRGNRS